jgi:hypothetical protein
LKKHNFPEDRIMRTLGSLFFAASLLLVPEGALAQTARGDDGRPPTTAGVSAYPLSGPPGTLVRVQASGFPPFSFVDVGVGRLASESDLVLRNLRTNPQGAYVVRLSVPEHAAAGERWVFVAQTSDHRLRGRSEPFAVTGAAAREGLTLRGTLTDEGVECPAMRGDDGRLFTLSGDVGFEPGERVEVRGTPVEISICMQGTTISVESITRLPR